MGRINGTLIIEVITCEQTRELIPGYAENVFIMEMELDPKIDAVSEKYYDVMKHIEGDDHFHIKPCTDCETIFNERMAELINQNQK